MQKPRKVFLKGGSYSWQIDYYDPQGKRHKPRFKRLADAEAVLAAAINAKREGRYPEIFKKKDEPVYLFRDLAADYLEAYAMQKNFREKVRIVGKVLVPEFGDRRLSAITYRNLELFRSRRRQVPTWRRQPRSVAQVNREMSILRHMLNKAVQWQWLETNPFAKGEPLFYRENNERNRYLTEEEAAILLAACLPHLKPIVETALNTGMRKGEILSLKWSQVRDGWIYLTETKSGRGRPVPINDAQAEVFREIRQRHHLKSPYVFCDEQGQFYGNVQRSFDSALRKAGIFDFRFHDLRHTCASWLVMAGADVVAVQKQLGHSSIKTTMRYAHLAPGHLKKSSNLIGTRRGNGKFLGTFPVAGSAGVLGSDV